MNGSGTLEHAPGATTGLVPGERIGPYELLFQAAEGGMATIWAARPWNTSGAQNVVAVKILSDVLREDPEGRAMFLDEARTAARITHPNIGQVLDYGEDRGQLYLAMDWIEGESLARLDAAQRARGGRLPLRWVLQVAAAACVGLHAAHEARDDDGELMHLVHRDVSPQNVMVTVDGMVKVVDFGVAKSRRRAQVTRVGVIKGKTGYFSPEQIAGHEIDRRSDIFSFGIMLYVLCTDHHPFRGRSAIETVQNIATRDPFSPRDMVPDMPRALDALILRALSKDPADRFDSALELGRALELINYTLGSAEASTRGDARVDEHLSNQQVGALVHTLLPGSADERRERLAQTAARLDAARERTAAQTSACPEAEASGSCAHGAGESALRASLSLTGVSTPEPPYTEGTCAISSPPRGESVSTEVLNPRLSQEGAGSAQKLRPAQPRPLGLLSVLALLGALALVTRAGEQLAGSAAAWDRPPAAQARAGVATEMIGAAFAAQGASTPSPPDDATPHLSGTTPPEPALPTSDPRRATPSEEAASPKPPRGTSRLRSPCSVPVTTSTPAPSSSAHQRSAPRPAPAPSLLEDPADPRRRSH
ncbi:serine/threonine-protein kinase [Chondromyces crocatus]|uniref:non-specific serine/threonine protein kinase n=1 Tax=Chondromyces crocatus TaxID=52 RepID=A0A0K1ERF7_CHOCO|nr:serine/threonine-protein kinase [Chondromyces crocatus]AKT43232.1 uncharacterized protein CMC5_074630 [Chondromyces crocatus]